MKDKETLTKIRVKDYIEWAKEITTEEFYFSRREYPSTIEANALVVDIAKMIQKEYHRK